MSRTIGRHWPASQRGEYTAQCSYCGAAWPSGKLRRDRSGNFTCPDDDHGADATTCNELNAAGARELTRRRRPMLAPVAQALGDPTPLTIVESATPECWYAPSALLQTAGQLVSWPDSSGNAGRSLAPVGAPSVTVADTTLGGFSTVTLDGVASALVSNGFDWQLYGTTGYYVWMVVRQNAWSSGDKLMQMGTSGARLEQTVSSPRIGNVSTAQVAPAVGEWVVLEAAYTSVAAANFMATDETERGGKSVGAGQVTPSLCIGALSGTSLFCSMSIAELAIWRGIPRAQERATLRSVYATRYFQ